MSAHQDPTLGDANMVVVEGALQVMLMRVLRHGEGTDLTQASLCAFLPLVLSSILGGSDTIKKFCRWPVLCLLTENALPMAVLSRVLQETSSMEFSSLCGWHCCWCIVERSWTWESQNTALPLTDLNLDKIRRDSESQFLYLWGGTMSFQSHHEDAGKQRPVVMLWKKKKKDSKEEGEKWEKKM